jgi:hypothetical protein
MALYSYTPLMSGPPPSLLFPFQTHSHTKTIGYFPTPPPIPMFSSTKKTGRLVSE